MISDLGRRLLELEHALEAPSALGSSPRMVSVVAFQDDDHDAAEAYCGALREAFPGCFVQLVPFRFHRPAGLKPDWIRPRKYLEYTPTRAEVSDLRPELSALPHPPGGPDA